MSRDTINPFSDNFKVTGPAGKWLVLLGFAAAAGGAWYGLRADVTRQGEAIETNRQERDRAIHELRSSTEAAIREIRDDQRKDREVLIRIDENVKALKERR